MSEKKEKVTEQAGNTGTSAQADRAAGKKTAAKKEQTEKAKQEKDSERPVAADAVVKIGKKLLAANPEMEVVYMTCDGRGFYSRNDAQSHARTLTNKAVTPVNK